MNRLQPVEEGAALEGRSAGGSLKSNYIQSEFSDSYKACYSNGSTRGFVSQTWDKKAD